MNARKAENQVLFKSFEAQEWKSAFTHFYMRLAFILLLLDKCFKVAEHSFQVPMPNSPLL